MSNTTDSRPTLTAGHHADAPTTSTVVMDNHRSYLAFGVAWLVGHGAFALSSGPTPLLTLPTVVPVALLAVGLVVAINVTAVGIARHQRRLTGPAALSGALLGAGWGIGFTSLFLLIFALAGQLGDPHVQALLGPTAPGLIVGMMYVAGGALHRDVLQYALGAWLALTSSAALFLGEPGMYMVLALAGGGSQLLAGVLETRRRAAAPRS